MIHKIWKQTIECTIDYTIGSTFDDKGRAWEIQNRLSNVFASRIAPVLDRHLNHLGPENEHITIDTLECDLGEISLNTLESDLIDALENILPLSLAKVVDPKKDRESLKKDPRQSSGEDSPDRSDTAATSSESGDQPIIAIFIFYLETGSLPWSFGEPDFNDFTQSLSTGLQQISTDEKRALQQTLSRPHAAIRFIRQFPRPFIKNCINTLWPTAAPGIKIADQLIRHINTSDESGKPGGQMDRFIYSIVLKILMDDPAIGSQSFIPVFAKAVRATQFPLKPIIIKVLEDNFSLSKPTKTTPRLSVLPSDTLGMAETIFSSDTGNIEKIPPLALTADTARPGTEDLLERHGYSISNAGMVLAGTFLVPYFKALGLLDKDQQFVSEDARTRAILSLHVLYNGPVFPAEYMCVLNKLLCGMPIQTSCLFDGQPDSMPPGFMPPVLESPDLSLIEKEAQKLLSAMIRHWEKIKNTSISGLRETFLRRDGILREHKNCWVLQIEKKGYDVLLDSISWSFSLIKTPWMKKPLEVQW